MAPKDKTLTNLFTATKAKINKFGFAVLKKCADTRYLKGHISLISFAFEKLFDVRLMNFDWIDRNERSKKQLLHSGSEGFAYSPKYKRVSKKTKISLPDIYAYYLRNSIVSSNSSSLIQDGTIFLERVSSIDPAALSFKEGHILYKGNFFAIVKLKAPVIIKKGIFLAGNGSFNYYHWLIEIAPKLEFISAILDGYPLLVAEDVLKIKTFKEILDILAPQRQLIYLIKGQQYKVEDMAYITTPNNMPFNLKPGYKLRPQHCLISFSSCKFIRDSALSLLPLKGKEKPPKIFLKRNNTRRSYNQEEVENVLLEQGFVSVKCEELTFIEQVALFSCAKYIVGPTGAAWANLIFGTSGSKALCWMAEEYEDFSAYSTLAEFAGVDLSYIYYKAGSTLSDELYNKNYRLDIENFKRSLELICQV